MARFYHKTVYTDAIDEIELKPMKEGRVYLLIENRSSYACYLNFDDHADSLNGIEIVAGGYYELERVAPDNVLRLRGTSPAGTPMRLNVTEGYI